MRMHNRIKVNDVTEFGLISEINLNEENSWKDKIFITFDIDWASDNVIDFVAEHLISRNIKATWFVTHSTPVLEKLRSNPMFELGIHPNFNALLKGDFRHGRSAKEIIETLMTLVPEANSVRSHSLARSSVLMEEFKAVGLSYECNHFIPAHSNIELKPWMEWNGLMHVPYFWEDDVACLLGHEVSMTEIAQRTGLKVFDFHPIHVFLNTEHLDRYQRTRYVHHNSEELFKHRYVGKGTLTRFLDLLNLAQPHMEQDL